MKNILFVSTAKQIGGGEIFLGNLDETMFRTNFDCEGSCNYAFNVILREPNLKLRDRLEDAMRESKVEFRRGSAGGWQPNAPTISLKCHR